MATQNGMVIMPLAPDEEPWTFYCNWYNIQTDEETGNSVTVYKWQCEPGTMYGQPMAYYQGENGDPGPCETVHTNLHIHVIDAGPPSPDKDQDSDADDTKFDNGVLEANGRFQICIEEPDSYGEPMVCCSPTDGKPGTESIATSGGTWTVTPG